MRSGSSVCQPLVSICGSQARLSCGSRRCGLFPLESITLLPIVDQPRESRAAAPPRDASPRTEKGTYAFVSLGCPKNLVDSERMLGLLQLDGYRLVSEPAGADLVVVNTCGFIEQARQESYGAIREMLRSQAPRQHQGRHRLGLPGRARERSAARAMPGDRLSGGGFRPGIGDQSGRPADRRIARAAQRISAGRRRHRYRIASRLRITPRHFAFLKISEGCDRLCTFFAIPKMRGKHATKPIEEVLDEARELVADGVRELNIVAQDTTYYGLDLYGRPAAGGIADRARQDRGARLDSRDVLVPDVLHRRADRGAGQGEADRALPGHAAAAHQRHDVETDATARRVGERPKNC